MVKTRIWRYGTELTKSEKISLWLQVCQCLPNALYLIFKLFNQTAITPYVSSHLGRFCLIPKGRLCRMRQVQIQYSKCFFQFSYLHHSLKYAGALVYWEVNDNRCRDRKVPDDYQVSVNSGLSALLPDGHPRQRVPSSTFCKLQELSHLISRASLSKGLSGKPQFAKGHMWHANYLTRPCRLSLHCVVPKCTPNAVQRARYLEGNNGL